MSYKNKKVKNKTKKYKKLNCSPKSQYSFSCYTKKNIYKLKSNWNRSNKNNKITSTDPYKIWIDLKNKLSNDCTNEKCWLDQSFMIKNKNKLLENYTFAPNAPDTWNSNPNEWLNSDDIIKVMRQYEFKYPKFKFIGPSPIDFNKRKTFGQCVWDDLCKFQLGNYIKNNITNIGIILNTDPHYLGGAHWICIYINIDKNFIYYFDSNADTTPKEVNEFIKKVIDQANQLNITLTKYTNTITHQEGDSECGMYVLYIIISLLRSNKIPNFKKRIPDKYMEKLRKILFN